MNKMPLLTDYDLKGLHLKNRMVMAPLTRSRADNPGKVPTKLHVEYYSQRASAGLIISEGSQVSEMAVGYVNTPGIYSAEQVAGWKDVTSAVHKKGGKIFCQLWHVGRVSHPDFLNGRLPHAPSAINPELNIRTYTGKKPSVTPKEMTIEDIKQTVNDFKDAARNAMEAGFDGVEIHSSNGYLFHQFFVTSANHRADEYGGNVENRTKIFFETIDAIKEVMPENRIGCRFNPSAHGIYGITADKNTIPTYDYLAEKLNSYDLAYVHYSEPFTDVSDVPFAETQIAKRYRKIYKGNLMINSNFNKENGNEIIKSGDADLVSFGKLFLANPDLPQRFELGAEHNEWDKSTFYTPGARGYIDYPFLSK